MVGLDRDPAVELPRDPPRAHAHLPVVPGSSCSVTMASASAADRRAPPGSPHPPSRAIAAGLALGSDRGDERAAGRENAVDLARHDVAFEAALQRHDEDVGGRERFVQPRLGLIRERTGRCQPARARPSPRAPGACAPFADDRDRQLAASTAADRRPRSAPSRFCDMPTLPECITTNRSTSPCCARERVVLGPRLNRVAVRPVVDDVDPRRIGALLFDQAPLHAVAERDDRDRRDGAGTGSRDRASASTVGVLEVLEQRRDLREDVLTQEDEARAGAARGRTARRGPRSADRSARRRRRADRAEARPRRRPEVADVVRPPAPRTGPAGSGVPYARRMSHAVRAPRGRPDLASRRGRPVAAFSGTAGDDRHVVTP